MTCAHTRIGRPFSGCHIAVTFAPCPYLRCDLSVLTGLVVGFLLTTVLLLVVDLAVVSLLVDVFLLVVDLVVVIVLLLVAVVLLVVDVLVDFLFLLNGHFLLVILKWVVEPQCLHEVLFLRFRLPWESRSVSIASSRSVSPDSRLSCTFGT